MGKENGVVCVSLTCCCRALRCFSYLSSAISPSSPLSLSVHLNHICPWMLPAILKHTTSFVLFTLLYTFGPSAAFNLSTSQPQTGSNSKYPQSCSRPLNVAADRKDMLKTRQNDRLDFPLLRHINQLFLVDLSKTLFFFIRFRLSSPIYRSLTASNVKPNLMCSFDFTQNKCVTAGNAKQHYGLNPH